MTGGFGGGRMGGGGFSAGRPNRDHPNRDHAIRRPNHVRPRPSGLRPSRDLPTQPVRPPTQPRLPTGAFAAGLGVGLASPWFDSYAYDAGPWSYASYGGPCTCSSWTW
jgi:hypothetical protein